MGNCSSSDSTQVATSKLVHVDGTLQEFSYPVKVSYLLQEHSTCFICNSDEMDFDDVVKAVHEDDVLQPGQLYFALPLSRLDQPLQAAEMAALAVKASSALMKRGGADNKCYCRRKRLVFSEEDCSSPCRNIPPTIRTGNDTIHRSRRGRTTNGGREKFTAFLSAIPE
ncbi:hypothetical protein TanjilG_22786 [Lupinus angustifolius]|uniref:Uncharacterized protein n=1 Tax=Lupinus angustifolius TaxID=3871 RepID=A0A394CJL0_LUPAN|nr:PREDICTED: uncharacterized protein LOC109348665 [Lupinus angustifolius]XP_019444725.1 PREDICTED: uncharacterized protein LOC109348666 [Lupinus angustifolius]OIW10978.1 hypothetical protein TanjilG_22785 [Lupinus angustifolius]OIW10979.1 hypothetical protein TanjilG_22786 [Lupinus angustifolius]